MPEEVNVLSGDPMQEKQGKGRKVVFLIFAVLLILAGIVFYLLNKKSSVLEGSANSAAVAATDTGELLEDTLAKIGNIIALPENEKPALLIVNDPEKLRGQPFFDKAKVGDQVLIYQQARKAILYDPLVNKILEVAALEFPPAAMKESVVEDATDAIPTETQE
ncbi:MAG: Uncharacterized protein G01um101448_1007 [Parcubacteria group bacterium Gr01-1014_48]|nr:MAG: Uncharacterized protein Greene041614_338 [Parcubacteria group bacterium Greene0416_14]TSC72259.1 MAG: Uncharacterized protein G01um101448_1007 [Parcubacteria group bacterium Gr01-1014_48]TSD00003.1 MAG: Uncharacterized protein Greene101415_1006 [Parcubacteria group bacterium Greene1014_15]TSD07229.1 MAG: Uncharacterized protein Greene07144_954 [Parcubacteria group bacterium Greene0714_4]